MTIVSRRTRCIQDWTAVPSVPQQDFYDIDPRFFHILEVWYDGWPLEKQSLVDYFYRGMVNGVAMTFSAYKRARNIQFSVWPFGLRAPGQSFLTAAIGAGDQTFTVVSSANFGASGGPGLGWLLLGGNELATYRSVSPVNTFSVVRRGQGGTISVGHATGDPVQEANIWIKGNRIATPVALPMISGQRPLFDPGFNQGSYSLDPQTDHLEIPDHLANLLEKYVLGKVREAENERQEAASLFKEFDEAVERASTDPMLHPMPTGLQVRTWPGPLLLRRRIIPAILLALSVGTTMLSL